MNYGDRRGGSALSEINITPFVDVVLVLLIIFLIVLLIFGANRLRDIGGAMGGAIRDFRSALSGGDEEQGKEKKEEEKS